MTPPRIAVDAMGGDDGVRVMVEGAAIARRRHEDFNFLLVGDEQALARLWRLPRKRREDLLPCAFVRCLAQAGSLGCG